MNREFLTYNEAADEVRVPARTIRFAVAKGELPVTRYNARVVRIAVFDLRTWRERKTCRKSAPKDKTSAF